MVGTWVDGKAEHLALGLLGSIGGTGHNTVEVGVEGVKGHVCSAYRVCGFEAACPIVPGEERIGAGAAGNTVPCSRGR